MERGLHVTPKAKDERTLKSTAIDYERLERSAADETFETQPGPPNPLGDDRNPAKRSEPLADPAAMGADVREERRQRELLEDALAMAQHANHAKSVFLANMSHDFRTPMNAIMSFTDIALDHLDDQDDVKGCLLRIKQASEHLLSLLNDVLDVSRIESGKLRLNEQPLDLLELGAELEEMFQAQVHERELDFTLDFSPLRVTRVVGDGLRLSQIFINLIGNAVKFTDPGGVVRVEAAPPTRLAADYQRFSFTVSDTGCGMSHTFIEHIFEPFERDRIDAVAHTVGTGLGMTITKNLIDMMGGSIEVKSELGKGSEFTIAIPLKVEQNDAPTRLMAERDAAQPRSAWDCSWLSGKRILVVDDDELSREVLRVLLGEHGLIVIEAGDGEEAIDRFKASEPGEIDAILMDVHMPGMNGCEATRIIRDLGRKDGQSVPIIATTACAFTEDRDRALAAGMTDHLSKPLDMQKLYRLLTELIGR